MILAMARSYIADIVGGTATATIQIQGAQTLRNFTWSAMNVATGKYELSTSGTSQIGTAQPDTNVLARVSIGANTTGNTTGTIPIKLPVKAFQSVYVHCTGSGNLGTIILS